MEEGFEPEVCHERTTREGCGAEFHLAGGGGVVRRGFCACGTCAECGGGCDRGFGSGCCSGASAEFPCYESCGGPGDTGGGCDGAEFFTGWRAEFVTDWRTG